jgi:hypothetical protein
MSRLIRKIAPGDGSRVTHLGDLMSLLRNAAASHPELDIPL